VWRERAHVVLTPVCASEVHRRARATAGRDKGLGQAGEENGVGRRGIGGKVEMLIVNNPGIMREGP